jgi:hypothetical protein
MKIFYAALTFIILMTFAEEVKAQSPKGEDFGFGIVLGEPTGATLKFWTQPTNALVVNVGASYFGSPRIGVDYLWHFDAFKSDVAYLYAGPGGVIGFGEGNGIWYKREGDKYFVKEDDEIGLGARGVFGVNVVPRDTPLETFFEIGVLIGLAPDFGSSIDAALGIRFYP